MTKQTSPATSSLTNTYVLPALHKGDTITVTVTPNDGAVNGAPASTSKVVSGAAPIVSSVVITPSAPKTNDLLTATVSATDADGDPISYTYQWYKNGVAISGATAATLNLATPGYGDKGDVITVTVTPSDGTLTGLPFTSPSVTVQNTPPVLDSVSVSPNPATQSSTLSALAAAHDVDANTLTYSYQWLGAGNKPIAGANSATYTPVGACGGDKFSVQATANDGLASSNTLTSAVITLDYTPSTATAALSPSGAHVGDTLTATTEVTDSDCDGDSIPTFVWKVNGVVTKTTVGTKGQTTDTFSTSALKTSDVVTVTVTPSEDDNGRPAVVSGTASSTLIAKVNHPPTATATISGTPTTGEIGRAHV